MSRRGLWRWLRAGLSAAVAVPAAMLLPPAPASAQGAVVVSVSPADAAALASAPDEVVITCSAPPDAPSSHVSLRGADDRILSAGEEPRTAGNTLRLPVSIATTGNFTVVYHVVLRNGDDAVGVARFSVGTGTPPPIPPQDVQDVELRSAAEHDHGIDPLGATLLVIDGLVVFGAVLWLISRPPPRTRR